MDFADIHCDGNLLTLARARGHGRDEVTSHGPLQTTFSPLPLSMHAGVTSLQVPTPAQKYESILRTLFSA